MAELPNSPDRFTEAGANYRWTWWKQAWRGWKAHPAAGTGAGSFRFTNLRYRTTSVDQTTEPHSLPVQFLTETGVVGLLLFVVAALGLVGAARRRAGPQLALALALPAYLVHGLIDIDWDFAAVSAPVFLIAGAVAARPERARRLSASAVLVGAGVAVAVVCSLFAVWLGDRWTAQATSRSTGPARAVDAREARALGQPARGRARSSPRPRRAAPRQPRRGARPASARRRELQPRTTPRRGTSSASSTCASATARGPRCTSSTASRSSNPQDPRNKEYDRALKLVNSGTPIC